MQIRGIKRLFRSTPDCFGSRGSRVQITPPRVNPFREIRACLDEAAERDRERHRARAPKKRKKVRVFAGRCGNSRGSIAPTLYAALGLVTLAILAACGRPSVGEFLHGVRVTCKATVTLPVGRPGESVTAGVTLEDCREVGR